jgi:hypothetical protein
VGVFLALRANFSPTTNPGDPDFLIHLYQILDYFPGMGKIYLLNFHCRKIPQQGEIFNMTRIDLANPKLIKAILFLQVIPILLFPPSTYQLNSQMWWLPALLVILAFVGVIRLFRKPVPAWALYLISFAQGFNIISRLLMIMPQSTQGAANGIFNAPFFILAVISMAASAFILWYVEKPEVKQQLMR